MRKKVSSLPGINVQQPFAQLLLSGKKTVETRTYPCPKKYLGVPILILETPGKSMSFKKRAVGIIKILSCFEYKSKKAFQASFEEHLVSEGTVYDWNEKAKWGWKVEVLDVFSEPVVIKQPTGIVFTKALSGFS